MGRTTLIQCWAFAFGCAPLLAHAVGPSTQPSADTITVSTDTSGDAMLSGNPDGSTADSGKPHRGDRTRSGTRTPQPTTEKSTDDAMVFLSEHSPERHKFIQALPDGERKTRIQNFAARAYQNWMRSKDDWELYKVIVKRVELEDVIFGLAQDLKSAGQDKQSSITTQLHNKVETLVDLGIQERQLRVDNLSRTIKIEQQKLDADSSDRKSLIDRRMKTILSDDRSGRRDSFK